MGTWGKPLFGPAGTLGVWAALTALILILVPAGSSNDLRALWLAAEALQRDGAVYPQLAPAFTMSPPPEWMTAHPGETLYPYLYPPLWAVLASSLVEIVAFETFAWIARLLNAVFLAACPILAWRISRSTLPLPVFAGIGLLALSQSFVGAIALMENQPQILVSFLVLLALERQRSGACVLAGAALALAAALKIYPVLFALLWLATGARHAATAFAITGGALGAVSILVAGWPLHGAFLETLAMIGQSVLVTPLSYALAPAAMQLLAPELLTYHTVTDGGWLYGALPPFAVILARVALLAALGALALAMRRADRDTRDALLWPAALVAVSLLSPLAWAYHYIPSVAFAPILVDRLGPRRGGLLLLCVLVPISPLPAGLALAWGLGAENLQIIGTFALLGLGATYAAMALRAPRNLPA